MQLSAGLIFVVLSLSNSLVETDGAGVDSDCDLKADVVFIVDSSRSIWPPHFRVELDFLANVTRGLNVGPDSTHVGVVSFSRGARVDLYLGQVNDPGQLQDSIRDIPFMRGDVTETYLGLRLAREELFRLSNGARKGVPRIIIIVTDGDSSDRAMTRHEADVIRKQGIQVFVVGIGFYLDPEQLVEMATRDSKSYVHTVSSFTTLDQALPRILPAACTAPELLTTPQTTSLPVTERATTPEQVVDEEAEQACESKKADVVFVLDKSSSITTPHFRTQLNFVNNLITLFNIAPDHTHVSVVTFDYEPKVEFGLMKYFTKSEVRKAVLKIKYTAGSTNTFRALELVTSHVLTPEGGARKEVAPVVIVVTDGKSSDEARTQYWAQRLKARGAYVFAIGVGNDTDRQELVNLGSQPTQDFVFEVNGYNALNTIRHLLAFRACEVPSGDLFVRCQDSQDPLDVIFVTDFTHAGGRNVIGTTRRIQEVAGSLMTSDGRVRVGLVSNDCPDVTDIELDQSANAQQFASFFQGRLSKKKGQQLSPLIARARERLTVVRRGARRGVKRLAVVFVHGPISDLKAATREVMRAKSSANRPGVQFVFVGLETAQEKQLLQLASERKSSNVRLLIGDAGKTEITWQDVLTQICEALES